MNKFPKACGKELGKLLGLPQEKSEEVLVHKKAQEIPTRYALSGINLMTYILTRKEFPQYQQP